MTKTKLTIIFLTVVACLLIVIGWLGYLQRKAFAETTRLKTDLQKTKSELFRVMEARDKLLEHLAQLTLENKLQKEADEAIDSELCGIVFTTEWNKGENVPQNDLKEISINEKLLYVFCKWRLSLREHTYTIKILDESKQIIFGKKYDLKPTEPTWNTWRSYYINKYLDKPGRWTVEIYLDGRKVGEKSINVLPEVTTVPSNSN